MSGDFDPNSFEEYLWNYEVDILGSEGLATEEDKRRLYAEWKKGNVGDNRAAGAAKAAKTRAKNATKGISQKGLTGSTKQKRWASEIRGQLIGGFSDENRQFFDENNVAASFWIENRNWRGSELSTKMDRLRADMEAAIEACNTYRAANYDPSIGGVPVTSEYDSLRKAAASASSAWDRFLSGEKA